MHLPLNLKPEPYSKRLKKKAYYRGLWGEKLAALYLWCKGYRILETRFKTPYGEIDLLVSKGSTLIAVEVKHRPSLEQALFSITPSQQRRIERAFEYYLIRKCPFSFFRFDVVLLAPWSWPLHFKGAWQSLGHS